MAESNRRELVKPCDPRMAKFARQIRPQLLRFRFRRYKSIGPAVIPGAEELRPRARDLLTSLAAPFKSSSFEARLLLRYFKDFHDPSSREALSPRQDGLLAVLFELAHNQAMITRRDTLLGAVALLWEVSAADAQTRNGTSAEQSRSATSPVFKHDLPNITMDDWEVTVNYVDYPPGRVGQPHHHAGFVLAYVLEGTVVTKISGQEERTYRSGEMFFEPPGSTHEVSRNASDSQPAKLLAMIFAKKGVPLTMPGPA